MTGARRFYLLGLALALPGCWGMHPAAVTPPNSRLAVIPTETPVPSEIPVQIVLPHLPAYAEGVRVTGFGSDHRLIFGPTNLPNRSNLELAEVSTEVHQLRIEPFLGHTVLAQAQLDLDLTRAPSLTVEDPPLTPVHTLRSLTVSSSQPGLAAGDGEQLQAMAEFSDEARYDLTKQVQWSSSEPATLEVSAQGEARGRQVGSADATCQLDALTGGVSVSVTSPRLVSLVVTPDSPGLSTLTTEVFQAEGIFSDQSTQDLTHQVEWSSSSPTVAAVDPDGIAATQGVGQTTIQARLGDLSGETSLAVSGPTVLNLSVGPPERTVPMQATLALHALATLSDGTVRDVTPLALWSSSSPVVNMTGPGQGQVQGAGQASVSASFAGMEISTAVSAGSEGSAPPPPPLVPYPTGSAGLPSPPGYPEIMPQEAPPSDLGYSQPQADAPAYYGGAVYGGGGYIGGYGSSRGQFSRARGSRSDFGSSLQVHSFGPSFVIRSGFGGSHRR